MARNGSASQEPREGHPAQAGSWLGVFFVGLIVAFVAASAYALRHWWLPPLASAQGARIDTLLKVFLILVSIVFLGIHVALAMAVTRFRGDRVRAASHVHENRTLELTWTITPAVILIAMTIAGGVTLARLHAAPPEDALRVEVTAEQFGWNIRYPGPDGQFGRTDPRLIGPDNRLGIDPSDPASRDDLVYLNELYLPVNRPVHVQIRSKDVLHSFFVPQFRMKQDAVPGRTTQMTLMPTSTGEFEIACAELCGLGHFGMKGLVKVLSAEEFDAWLAQQRPKPLPQVTVPVTPEAAHTASEAGQAAH